MSAYSCGFVRRSNDTNAFFTIGHSTRTTATRAVFSGADKAEFDKTARKLVGVFQKNFAKFENEVDADVRAAAPEVKLAAE